MADNFLYRNQDKYYEYDNNNKKIISDKILPPNYDKDVTADYRRINNIKTLTSIINVIEKKIGRALLANEKQSVRDMLNNPVNPAYNYRFDPTKDLYLGNLRNWDINTIVTHLANRWIKIKNSERGNLLEENIHEILREKIGTTAESGTVYPPTFIQPEPVVKMPAPKIGTSIDSILGKKNRHELLNLLNPRSLISHNYIYLDTRQRNLSASSGINSFVWNSNNNGNTDQGNFTYLGVLRDIIQLRCYPFRIPYPSDGSADNGARQITIGFKEFSTQSFIARTNWRFQIVCQATVDGNYISLNPYLENNGIFHFDKPITTLNQLTLSFGSPINIINFDKDRLFCTFTYGAITIANFTEQHNLITGDIVSFADFNTAAPSIDAPTIAVINQNRGHTITKINNFSFSIAVDTTSITPIPGLSIICIFDSKTFQIPIQLAFVRPDEGAYKT